MKIKHILIAATAVAMVAVSCKKENPDSVILRVSPETLTFEAKGGSESLSVVTLAEWTVSGNERFAIDRTSGKGPGTITVTALATDNPDTIEEKLTFTAGIRTVTVTIIQKGAGIPEDEISISPESLDFGVDASSQDVVVTASGEWNWDLSADWATIVRNDNGVSVSVEENDGDIRSTSVVFTCGSKTATLTITQAKHTGPLTKIKTKENFEAFYTTMGSYADGTVITLENDIDLSGFTVNKTKAADMPATITLEGNNHCIKNWDNNGYPLFKLIKGVIQNLVIDSSCTISYDTACGAQFGILGTQNQNLIKNCVNRASFTASTFNLPKQAHWGMFVGINRNIMEDCVNEGNLTITSYTASDNLRFGAFAGSHAESSGITQNLLIKNCTNKGNFSITKTDESAKDIFVGGIAGYCDGEATAGIEGCVNEGTMTANAAAGFTQVYTGGVAGMFRGGMITACKNFGKVSSTASAGGIIGRLDPNKVKENKTMEGCAVNAEITGAETAAGLVFGTCKDNSIFIFGSEASPIKLAGKVNGTAATEGNFESMLYGSSVVAGAGSKVNAKYEVATK